MKFTVWFSTGEAGDAVKAADRMPGACLVKVAVISVAAFIEAEQAPAPEQPPPDHPVKIESLAGLVVNVTTLP